MPRCSVVPLIWLKTAQHIRSGRHHRPAVEREDLGRIELPAGVEDALDPHLLVEALTQSQLAVETAVTVRNRVVEAYQEILRMPV